MATYRVGYCKPPKDKQFRKGVSGNPNGRPKGAPNMPKILQKTLSESVEIIEGGKPKTISKMEAATRRLVDQAIAGDMHAFRVLSALMQIARDPADIPSTSELEGADQKLLQTLVRQFGAASF